MKTEADLIFEAYAGEPQPISKEGGPSATPLQTPPSAPDSTEARIANEVIDLLQSIAQHAERIAGLWDNNTPIIKSLTAKKNLKRMLNLLDHYLQMVDRH